jgi:cytidylate kinase
MKLTLSGTAGSGKGTLAKLLVDKYNLAHYDVGNMRREEAKKRNMTIAQFNTWSESNNEGDLVFDKKQEEIGKTQDNFIMVGRLSWHFIPSAIKILLLVDDAEAARRIYEHTVTQGRVGEAFTSIDEATQKVTQRNASDKFRYMQKYGVVIYDPAKFDIVVDTTHKTIEDVFAQVTAQIQSLIHGEFTQKN